MQIAGEVICEIFLQFPAARWKIGEPLIRRRMKRWTHYQREKAGQPPLQRRRRRRRNSDSEGSVNGLRSRLISQNLKVL